MTFVENWRFSEKKIVDLVDYNECLLTAINVDIVDGGLCKILGFQID